MAKSKDRGEKKQAKAGKVKEKKAETGSAPPTTETKGRKTELGSSIILTCHCAHVDQDSLHGKGNRVFNIGSTSRACTVCGAGR